MSAKITLTAELREDVGKGASRRLRRLGNKVPAIIYGAEAAPQNLTLAVNEVNKAMEQETFYSQIMNVVIDGNATQAVVRDLQRSPGNGKVQHIDFQRISANKTMTVSVPLHFINEEECVGVKMNGGSINHNLTEVEISCLPANLPEYIEVDMVNVDVGDSVHLSDLPLPDGVTIVALSYGDEDRDIPVANVAVLRAAVEEDEADAELEDAAEGAADAADADDAEGDSDGEDDTE
ncbi:MAG: 50S ribosomal protein L25/general stress protein Ctc [Pseudomonadales bacterium]